MISLKEQTKIKDFILKLMDNDHESKELFEEFIKREYFNKKYQEVLKLCERGLITKQESYSMMVSDKYKQGEVKSLINYYALLKNDPAKLYYNLLENEYFYI